MAQTDLDAIRQVVDVLNRTDKFNVIKSLIEELYPIIPKNTLGFDTICYAYYKAKDYKTAIKYGEFALGAASATESLAIRYNLGKCYLNANEPIKARNSFAIVSKLQPEKIDVKLDLAAAMYACNQKEDAMVLLLNLEENGWQLAEKDETAVQFNLGAHYMRNGDFKKGMNYLSLGRKLRIWGSYTHNFPIPEWTGQEAVGKHVLIIGEGGIGDEIINARFVKHFNDRGMKASFASCHKMDSIFSRMPFEVTQNYQKFTTDIPTIADYDYWAPAMNLPKALKVDFADLWSVPYLTVNTEYDTKWKEIIDSTSFKVGLRWSGNPLYEQDLHRSIPLADIVDVIPTEWKKYSIQKENTEVLANFPDIVHLESQLETFEDALAAMWNLDLVITSCTSVAHAAAALGKQVIIFVPIMDYYVWAEGKSTSSWYGDNVTLIRQTEPKSWASAITELKTVLEKYK